MNDYFESIKNKKLALRTYNILIVAVIAWGLGINVLIFNLGTQGLKNLDFKATNQMENKNINSNSTQKQTDKHANLNEKIEFKYTFVTKA